MTDRTGAATHAYTGVESIAPLQLVVHNRDPNVHDKKNYLLGTWWLNPSNNTVWVLVSLENRTALWIQFNTAIGDLLRIETSTGQTVPTGLGIIHLPNSPLIETRSPGFNSVVYSLIYGGDGQTVIGQGAADPLWGNLTSALMSIIITPNLMGPGTINIDLGGAIINTTYQTDIGNATPIANILNVIGDGIITTQGAANTITIDIAPLTVHTDAGDVTPVANSIDIVGDGFIETTGVGNTVNIILAHEPQGRISNDCAFLAYLNSPRLLIAGSEIHFILPCNAELFDTGNNYNPATNVFVTPRAGQYYITAGLLIYGIPMGMITTKAQARLEIWANAIYWTSTYFRPLQNVVVSPDYGNSLSLKGSWILSVGAGTSIQITCVFYVNSAPVVPPYQPPSSNVYGAPLPNIYTYFGGYQI